MMLGALLLLEVLPVRESPLGSVIGNCNGAEAVAVESILLIFRFDDPAAAKSSHAKHDASLRVASK
jgi:hypothetical protein